MPLVQIDVLTGWTDDELDAVSACVQQAMVDTLDVPERDHFQLIEQRSPRELRFNRGYLDQERSDRFVLIRITLSAGRTTEAKQAFYARTLELLAERVGTRPDDLTIVLTENQRENWSFAGGRASYVELPREQWR